MSRSRLFILGLVALAFGGFLAMQVYRNLQSRTSAAPPATVDVLIAARDIQLGARIVDLDLKIGHFAQSDLPGGAFSGKSQGKVLGRGAVVPISKGEFILVSKLAPENSGSGLPSLIPPGMRAVSVRVNDVVSVAGFVVPGTRVDVMLTGTPTGGKEPVTTTVLENALVLAVGQHLERNSSGDPQTAPVITLQVTPEDAQKLALAGSEGRIQLALRNTIDEKTPAPPPVMESAMFSWGSPAPAPHQARQVAVQKPAVVAPASPYTVEIIMGGKRDSKSFPIQQAPGQQNQ